MEGLVVAKQSVSIIAGGLVLCKVTDSSAWVGNRQNRIENAQFQFQIRCKNGLVDQTGGLEERFTYTVEFRIDNFAEQRNQDAL